jgi:fructosamine-3-kinase
MSMLESERDALLELAGVGAVRVPRPLACVCSEESAVLAIEWLDLDAPDAAANRALGEGLARLHRPRTRQHGWHRDNTIGATPQPNAQDADWIRFFRTRRLQYQLGIAAANGFGGELQEQGMWLCDRLDLLFCDYRPLPSLLHGDLWAGNWGRCDGLPVMFDPAVYYGDRESDIAMTRLFGGFTKDFYDAYQEAWPLHQGFESRIPLYQLYHVLNHLNLFGCAYLGQALQLIRRLRQGMDRAQGSVYSDSSTT